MSPLGPPPPDTTNRVADDPRAIALGERLFHDIGVLLHGHRSCATCHLRVADFADMRPQGAGLVPLDRNTPSVPRERCLRWQFWDGRADTLWMQALGPSRTPRRWASPASRSHAASRLPRRVRGPLRRAPAPRRRRPLPRARMPRRRPWDAMSTEDRAAVDAVFVNFGKAIAAFRRRTPEAPAFDRYLAGDVTAMTERARAGLRLFLDAGCAQGTYHEPALSIDSLPQHRDGHRARRQRARPGAATVRALLASPFRADGPFSDDRAAGAPRGHGARGHHGGCSAPRRSVTSRARGRGGTETFGTLEAVALHYADVATGHHQESRRRRGRSTRTSWASTATGSSAAQLARRAARDERVSRGIARRRGAR
ncbi:MAG: cytochrome-c peroxidase [Polyangiales bacterium]